MSTICDVCGKEIVQGGKRCDYPAGKIFKCKINTDGSDGSGYEPFTCDRDMHDKCAVHLYGDNDLCPEHAGEMVKQVMARLHDIPKISTFECGSGEGKP